MMSVSEQDANNGAKLPSVTRAICVGRRGR
jgi:hypothetical protein